MAGRIPCSLMTTYATDAIGQNGSFAGGLPMNWIFSPLLIFFLVALPIQAAPGASAKVSGGFGCDRNSEGAVCFVDGCICAFQLSIDGEVDSATVEQVRKLFDVRRANKGRSELEGFSINSPGGSVAAAMEIGRLFRNERAWIAVSQDGICVSACVRILAGAVDRALLAGRIGIHRPYLDTTPERPLTADEVRKGYGRLLQDLRAYLREMNVSERLADDMLAIEPENVHYLTQAELNRYGLAGIDPVEQQTKAVEHEMRDVIKANQLGLDRREYTRRKALANDLCSLASVHDKMACKRRVLKSVR